MSDDENKDKPRLKSIDEFVPEESTGKIFDLSKEKAKKEDGELKTKFCFKHQDTVYNFTIRGCSGGGVHCAFITGRLMSMPFGEAYVEQTLDDKHIELSKFQKFLNKIGFNCSLEKKIGKEIPIWRQELIDYLNRVDSVSLMEEKFKL